jgi:tripartite-type tricarboxylate transporter receptor subunit TctC
LWIAILAPAGTPAEIVRRLNAETGGMLRDPEVQRSLRAAGVLPSPLGPAELGAFLRAERDKWGKVVRATGATVN